MRLGWMASEINSLKFDYFLNLSKNRELGSKSLFEAFICNCVRLYKTSFSLAKDVAHTEYQPGDDACLLAVMGLVRLAEMTSEKENDDAVTRLPLLQAAYLLEFLLSRSKHNFQALLLLVHVYLLLGAGSLAMKTFARLNVKNGQYDTIAHILFTRIASIHPHAASSLLSSDLERKDRDPLHALELATAFYRQSGSQLLRMKRLGLEKQSYASLKNLFGAQELLTLSFSKMMFVIERRRIKRLVKFTIDDEDLDIVSKFQFF